MRKLVFMLRASSKNMITVLLLLFVSISCFLFGCFQFLNLSAFQNEYYQAGLNDYQLKLKDERLSSNYTLLDYEKNFLDQLQSDEAIDYMATVKSLPVISYHLNPVATQENNQDNFMLMFYADHALIDDFATQNRVLIDGSPLNGMVDNECLISEELARRNNLKVGSVLTFLHPSNWNLNFYFRVVGIYQDYTLPQLDNSDINRRNEIISSESVLNKMIQRYAGQVEIPVNQTIYFSMSEQSAKRIIPLLPSRFELINGSKLYHLNLNLFNRYRQLIDLLLLSAVVMMVTALYLIIFKCMPKWIHLARMHRISGIKVKLYIRKAVLCCYGGLIVLPLILVSLLYNPFNDLLLEKFVRHRGLFADNTSGILITQKMLPYFEALLDQFYCELNIGNVVLLAFILSVVFSFSVKLLAGKIQKEEKYYD